MSDSIWISIGSAPSNDLVINNPAVEPKHADARATENGQVLVLDYNSRTGIASNRPDAKSVSVVLNVSDTLYLGNVAVPAELLFQRIGLRGNPAPSSMAGPADQIIKPIEPPDNIATPPRGTIVPLGIKEGLNYIGRPLRSDIPFDHPTVAARHALLTKQGSRYFIEDLGSLYGTFLNGERVGRSKVEVPPNGVIGIAGFRMRLDAPADSFDVTEPKDGIEIRAIGLENEVGTWRKKRLNLDAVDLHLPAGKLVALMGPSGAGKTTLLRALGGQCPPKAGHVFFNDINVYGNFDEIRSMLGYVPQDEIFHQSLKVQEILEYTARLRLPAPKDKSEQAMQQKLIKDTLTLLGIEKQAETPANRISGGQRKRVNLAMELLAAPQVLVLDEPTSGLSSADTLRVIRILRDLAHQEHRTVLVTIHTPPSYVFELFDLLAVVDNHGQSSDGKQPSGRLVYLGRAQQAGAYFQSHDPSGEAKQFSGADAVLEALDKNPAKGATDWEAEFQRSQHYRDHVSKPLEKKPIADKERRSKAFRSIGRHFAIQTQRLAALKLTDSRAVLSLLLQPFVVGVLIGLVTGKLQIDSFYRAEAAQIQALGKLGKTLFLLVVSSVWFGCNNSVREIVGEWAIYMRERLAGLRIPSYLASKLTIFALICALQTIVSLFMVQVMLMRDGGDGLKGSWPLLWLVLWITSMVGVSMGLFVSASTKTNEQAIQLVPLILLPMIIFGGGMTRLQEMPGDYVKRGANVIPARWAFEAMLLVENQKRPVYPLQPPPNVPVPNSNKYKPEFRIVKQYFLDNHESYPEDLIQCLGILSLMGIASAAGAGWTLRSRDVHK